MIAKPSQLVLPWNLDQDFSGDPLVRDLIISKLRSHGIDIRKYQNLSPKNRGGVLVRSCKTIVNAIFEEESPWFIVASPNISVLVVLAELIPIVYALSSHMSVMSISSLDMVKAVRASHNPRSFDDSAETYLESVDRYGLVIWTEFLDSVTGLLYSEDEIFSIFKRRFAEKRATLFFTMSETAVVQKVVAELKKKVFKTFENAMGKFILDRSEVLVVSAGADVPKKEARVI